MILINDIWYDGTDIDDLVEIAEQYNQDFADALRSKFKEYEDRLFINSSTNSWW